MNNESLLQLYRDLNERFSSGSEEEARQFLSDHFREFPKDLQDSILLAVFDEALTKATDEQAVVTGLKEDAFADLGQISKLRQMLDDKLKLLDLEEKMKS